MQCSESAEFSMEEGGIASLPWYAGVEQRPVSSEGGGNEQSDDVVVGGGVERHKHNSVATTKGIKRIQRKEERRKERATWSNMNR